MMYRMLLPGLIAYLALSSCVRTDRQNSSQNDAAADSLNQVLLAKVEDYYADMSERNWEAYAGHFWPGAHLTTVWQPPGSDSLQVTMTTIEQFVGQADRGPGSRPIFEEKMLDAQLKAYGNLAMVWATYAAKFGTKDSLMEWQGIDAFTYMKHNGEWRIASLGYTNKE